MFVQDASKVREFVDFYARGDDWHEIGQSKESLGYGWIHYGLIRSIRLENILVIGSRYGFIPAVCAMACRDNKKGKVDFVDAGFDQSSRTKVLGSSGWLTDWYKKIKFNLGIKRWLNRYLSIEKTQQANKEHWGGVGFWKRVDVDKHFDKFGLEDYLNFHLMKSGEFAKKHKEKKWNYVYLDGDHSYEGAKADFERFWPRVKAGGFLGLHDIYTKKAGGLQYGVSRLWNELKGVEGYNVMEMSGKCGLGLIQK